MSAGVASRPTALPQMRASFSESGVMCLTEPKSSSRSDGSAVGRAPKGERALSWVLSVTAVFFSTTLLSLFTPQLWHWMIVPTSVAGILFGVDVADWVRGRLDALQPRALVALFGFHLCYIGPLMHVAWDYWPKYVHPAQDWRVSLGVLAVVNVTGLVLYRIVIAAPANPAPAVVRQLNVARFKGYSVAAILVGLIALVAVVVRFGGPIGYIRVISGTREELAGNGWLLILAESWPMVLFASVLMVRRSWFRTHLIALLVLTVGFFLVQFTISGLRGSRGNTVWPSLIAIGLIHLIVRPVARRVLVAGALLLVSFMYVYGFYKAVGTDVFNLARGQTSTTALARETGRTLPLLLLEDFGRAGTQSVVVDRLARGGTLSWGMTYVGDIAVLMPDSVVPDPPVDKSQAGTDLLYAQGAYDAGLRSSRIFGLVGEGMLNWGVVGGALAFLPFAVFVRWADRVWRTATGTGNTVASLMAPSLTALCLLALGSDLDNVLWLFYGQALPLLSVVMLSRCRTVRQGFSSAP